MTVRVLVSGAAGNIGYAIIPMICHGEVFGHSTNVEIVLFDIRKYYPKLSAVQMEITDGAYPLVSEIIVSTDPEVAFKGVQYAFLIGGLPRGKGMERSDLIGANTQIFETTGRAIDKYADKRIKICVVANPCNTNCWTLMHHCPSIPRKNFSAMTRLDYNRTQALIAGVIKSELGIHAKTTDVRNCIIWGNHSTTQYPDINHATYMGKPLDVILKDKDYYFHGEFIKTIQQRGKAIIDIRGLSSAMSAAKAACNHMRDWVQGTAPGCYTSMAVCSDGNKYGIEDDLVYSFPVICKDGEWHFVDGLYIDSFSRKLLDESQKELKEEKKEACAVLDKPPQEQE